MLEAGDELDLPRETLGSDCRRQILSEDLDRNLSPVLVVLSEIDGGHTAAAHFPDQLVPPGEEGFAGGAHLNHFGEALLITEGKYMILVAGATGVLGSEIVRRLLARGEKVRAMARSTSKPEAVDRVRKAGAEIVVADLKDPAAGTAKLYGPGKHKIRYVAVADVAELAVQSLSNTAAANATIPVGGPEEISQRDAVALSEEAFGKKFKVTEITEEALEAQWKAAQNPFDKSFAALMLWVARTLSSAWIKGDPWLEPLRQDPRFAQLVSGR